MKLLRIYECLCDETRLRILNLLLRGPLCVCHLQECLQLPQVKVSKHLSYLRERGMVCVERSGNWMIYSLPAGKKRPPELDANLACLQDCLSESGDFKADLRRLEQACPECAAGERASALRKQTT